MFVISFGFKTEDKATILFFQFSVSEVVIVEATEKARNDPTTTNLQELVQVGGEIIK